MMDAVAVLCLLSAAYWTGLLMAQVAVVRDPGQLMRGVPEEAVAGVPLWRWTVPAVCHAAGFLDGPRTLGNRIEPTSPCEAHAALVVLHDGSLCGWRTGPTQAPWMTPQMFVKGPLPERGQGRLCAPVARVQPVVPRLVWAVHMAEWTAWVYAYTAGVHVWQWLVARLSQPSA